MIKIESSGELFAFAFRFLHCCLIVVFIGPIGHTANAPPTVTRVSSVEITGFSLVWMSETQSVYFIDLSTKSIHKYQATDKGELVSAKLDAASDAVTFLVPISANQTTFGVALMQEVVVFLWDGKTTTEIKNSYSWSITNGDLEFINCGEVDSSGRLWVGTTYSTEQVADGSMARRGRLFLLSADGTPAIKIEDICEPYGIAWNPAGDQIYVVDQSASQIISYPFKNGPGDIGKELKVVFDFTANNITCVPNDLAVDAGGNLWITCIDKNYIVQIDIKTSTVAMQVDFPESPSMTSVVFGGTTLEDLYVTGSGLFLVTNTGSKGIGGKAVNVSPSPAKPA